MSEFRHVENQKKIIKNSVCAFTRSNQKRRTASLHQPTRTNLEKKILPLPLSHVPRGLPLKLPRRDLIYYHNYIRNYYRYLYIYFVLHTLKAAAGYNNLWSTVQTEDSVFVSLSLSLCHKICDSSLPSPQKTKWISAALKPRVVSHTMSTGHSRCPHSVAEIIIMACVTHVTYMQQYAQRHHRIIRSFNASAVDSEQSIIIIIIIDA